MPASYDKAKGFTIVELVVVVTVLGLLTGVVLNTLGKFYGDNISSLGKASQDTQTRGVLRSIEQDLSNASGFLSGLSGLSQPLGSNNGTSWSYLGTGPSNRVLIASSFATDKSPSDPTRVPVFVNRNGCNPSLEQIAQNASIYFIAQNPVTSKNDLYRRTITNYTATTGETLCAPGVIYRKQSCAPSVVALYASRCAVTDANILRDVESFSVSYYGSPNQTSPSVPATDNGDRSSLVQSAKAIMVTVTTNNFINGQYSSNTSSIRISLTY